MFLKNKFILVVIFSYQSLFSQSGNILFSAIDSENMALIKDSVGAGVEINAKNSQGLTPLMYAIKKNSIKIINYFLTLPIDLEKEDDEGNIILHYLYQIEDKEVLTRIFKYQKISNLVNKKNKTGSSPLNLAIENTNYIYANKLLAYGADANEINNEGKPVLLVAHEKNLIAKSQKSRMILNELIESTANVNIHTSNAIKENSNTKKSLLFEVTELEDIELCKLLIKKGANIKEKFEGNSLLHLASRIGNKNLISLYLDYALLIDERGENGETPLMVALKRGNTNIIQFLINRGANVNLANTNGDTPLSLAVGYADLNIVRLLIEKGGDINHINEYGNTLIMESVKGDNLNKKINYEIIALLVNSGLKINSKNIYGNTALSYAINKKNIILLKYLIKLGADVNISDSLGNSPLHKVVLLALFERLKNKELDEILEILFTAGSNPNSKNNEGFTPLHLAVKPYKDKDEKAAFQLVQKLLDYSADPNIEDKMGANSFDYSKGEILSLLNTARDLAKPELELKSITNSPSNDTSLGMVLQNDKIYHLGDYDTKRIASLFNYNGKLEKQVLVEGAVSLFNNSNDGIYIAKEIREFTKNGNCASKLYLQKLNYSLEELWNTLLEEPSTCNTSEMKSVLGDNKNNIFIQYKHKNINKLIKINLSNGTRVSETNPIEISNHVFNFQDQLFFVGSKGIYIYSLNLQLKNKKIWNDKKKLLVYLDENFVYSVLPLIAKPGFTITKSDLQLETIWKRKFSSQAEDIPLYIDVIDGEIFVSGETKGNFHANRNIGRDSKDIFLLKLDSNGNRKFTYQIGGKLDDKLLGMAIAKDKKVYLHGTYKEKIFEKDCVGSEDIFILRYK